MRAKPYRVMSQRVIAYPYRRAAKMGEQPSSSIWSRRFFDRSIMCWRIGQALLQLKPVNSRRASIRLSLVILVGLEMAWTDASRARRWWPAYQVRPHHHADRALRPTLCPYGLWGGKATRPSRSLSRILPIQYAPIAQINHCLTDIISRYHPSTRLAE